jgi:hypothetical protein
MPRSGYFEQTRQLSGFFQQTARTGFHRHRSPGPMHDAMTEFLLKSAALAVE